MKGRKLLKKYIKGGCVCFMVTFGNVVFTPGIYKASANLSTFYYGHCTYYVAMHKNIQFSGNAKDWLANAKAKFYNTGQEARKRAVVVFDGPDYNNQYGHVAIIEDIIGDNLIISEMNYKRKGQITYRRISKYDINILGFIYF